MTSALAPRGAGGIQLRRQTPEEVLEDFLGSVKPATRKAYEYDLGYLGKHLGTDRDGAIRILLTLDRGQANALAQEWLNAMAEAKLSSATRARRLGTLRSFSRAARLVGAVDWTIEVKRPKVRAYRNTKGPDQEVIHKLFAACGDDLAGRRDHVLLVLLYLLALRRFEVAAATCGDVGRNEEGTLYVPGKGDNERDIPLGEYVADQIDQWTKLAGLTNPTAPLVFRVSGRGFGQPLSKDGVDYVVERIAKRAKVKHVWPHALRHSAITQGLIDMQGDVVEVQGFSRHESVDTVMIYNDNRKRLGLRVQDSLALRVAGAAKEKP